MGLVFEVPVNSPFFACACGNAPATGALVLWNGIASFLGSHHSVSKLKCSTPRRQVKLREQLVLCDGEVTQPLPFLIGMEELCRTPRHAGGKLPLGLIPF